MLSSRNTRPHSISRREGLLLLQQLPWCMDLTGLMGSCAPGPCPMLTLKWSIDAIAPVCCCK